MKLRLVFFLLLASVVCASFGTQSVFVNATYNPGITGNSGGAPLIPVEISVASTTAVNLFANLPNNDFTHVILAVSSGSAYLVGPSTTAASASTVGLLLTSTPMVLELPNFAKDQGQFWVFGVGAGPITSTMQMVPYKSYRNQVK